MIGTTLSMTKVIDQPLEKATAMPATKVPKLWIRFPTCVKKDAHLVPFMVQGENRVLQRFKFADCTFHG